MADVSHELGSLRFVVDSPLSSKVAMFNNQANQHKQSQLLNPFSNSDGRVSPKPQFSKDEYGKPLAGSLTEMRGQKANIHVMKEMLELCQIIDSEGYTVKDEPTMRVIPFGELFNIYNYISDKVVGILLRARKHKLVEFEGEMLFQRRDDDVPIFLLKPIQEIRQSLEAKMEEMKRATSPAPQATSVLLDRSAHMQKLKQDQEASLGVPKMRKSKSRSPSPSPATSAAGSRVATPTPTDFDAAKAEVELKSETEPKPAVAVAETAVPQPPNPEITVDEPPTSLEEATASGQTMAALTADIPDPSPAATVVADNKTDINNNSDDQVSDAPVSAVIEASAEHVRRPSVEDGASTETTASSVAVEATAGAVSEVPPSAEASAGNAAV